ncbi:cellulose biosynthesis protein BcsO [Dickeya lacustris]|uniref:Cellulose biosynthesis protein BcsO n=1 Tax=Dickeya lacustris TaxID=2259638 RepID=A0ABY8G2U9_9GAMM|nr:cellulose biosynthesis protein BcsO [Dickeya lacustris]WFN54267.1 cellulose biosynthesis protein BcsO [Dickeya lacustris]
MNSYDDMQRFRDKAQIKDIDFRDMSSQMLQSDTVAWPLMKQLLRNPAEDDALSGVHATGVAQPAPINPSLFNEPTATPATARLAPKAASPDATPALLSAVAASLAPPAVASAIAAQSIAMQPIATRSITEQLLTAQSPVAQAVQPIALVPPQAPLSAPVEPLAEVRTLQNAPRQAFAAATPVRPAAFAAAASAQPDNSRFRALFSSRSQPDNTPSLSKTMLLKPLLEKIALCR